MVLPFLKLGTLAIRTIAKPIAIRLKNHAGLHPRFRQFIINIAQANHRFSTTVQRRIYGHSTDIAIRPLNEERAVEAASNILGELFVFSAMKKTRADLATELDSLKLKLQQVERCFANRSFLDTLKFWQVAHPAEAEKDTNSQKIHLPGHTLSKSDHNFPSL